MSNVTILGIKLNQRTNNALALQEVLSKYGCSIKTRIGLHPFEEGVCSATGIILLELAGDDTEKENLEKELKTIPEAEIQKMVF